MSVKEHNEKLAKKMLEGTHNIGWSSPVLSRIARRMRGDSEGEAGHNTLKEHEQPHWKQD